MFDACQGSNHIVRLDRDHEHIGYLHLLGVSDHSDWNCEVHQPSNGCPVFLQVLSAIEMINPQSTQDREKLVRSFQMLTEVSRTHICLSHFRSCLRFGSYEGAP